MVSEIINISKEELYKLVRNAVRDELHKIEEISNKEQTELEKLHGISPKSKSIDFEECIELGIIKF